MNTKQLRQKILDLAIRGKLVPQDPNDEPASVLLERIKAEKEQLINKPHYPFEIPNGWCWVTLAEISNYGCCTNVAIDDIPNDAWILELEDLEKDSARILQRLTKSERQIKGVRHSFKKGNVLYSKLRTYLNKVLVADKDGSCTTEIIPFSLYGGICAKYISFVLRSKYFVDYAIQCGYGVKMPRLSTTDAHNGLIPLPPLKEQLRIVRAIEEYICTIDMIDNDKVELLSLSSNLKNKILQFAISGKLVPQDPADEPAEELLRRINPSAVPADKSHYQHMPHGWSLTTMNFLCQLYDGERQEGERINLDAKYLRGRSKGEMLNNGRFVPKYTTMILVDGENSGEIFTAPIDGYQGSTFKLLNISTEMNVEYVKMIIRIYQKRLRDNKVGSAIPHLNKKMFKAIEVPVPPLKEQARIVEKVSTLFSHIEALSECL